MLIGVLTVVVDVLFRFAFYYYELIRKFFVLL